MQLKRGVAHLHPLGLEVAIVSLNLLTYFHLMATASRNGFVLNGDLGDIGVILQETVGGGGGGLPVFPSSWYNFRSPSFSSPSSGAKIVTASTARDHFTFPPSSASARYCPGSLPLSSLFTE